MATKAQTDLLNFRPGALAGKIEAAAKKNGCSKSDVMRRALEMYLGLEPLQPLATYLGAAAGFVSVAKAATELGLFSRELYVRLVETISATEGEVERQLEPLYRELYPGETPPREFQERVHTENLRRHREGKCGLRDEEMIEPSPLQRWNHAKIHWEEQFHDLKEARRTLQLHRGDRESRPAVNLKLESETPSDLTARPFPVRGTKNVASAIDGKKKEDKGK